MGRNASLSRGRPPSRQAVRPDEGLGHGGVELGRHVPSELEGLERLSWLLICSGIGSRFANRVSDAVPFIGIVVWILLDILVFKNLFYSLGHLEMLPRILITVLLICPLGFFMGMPFPKGTLKVRDLIDWGFAVNGAASVLGSTLIVLAAFAYGFTAALLFGAFLYFLAFLLVSLKSAW